MWGGNTGWLFKNGWTPPSTSAARVFSTYVQTDAPAGITVAGSSTTTFSNVNIGAAAANRVVVVSMTGNVGDPSLSMTIGGVSATLAVAEGGHTVSEVSIYYALVPTGTTANIVINWTATPHDIAIVVGKFNYGTSLTPFDTKSAFASTASSQTLNTNIPTGGFAVMVVASSPSETSNWTNFDSNVSDHEEVINDGSNDDKLYVNHSTIAASPQALIITLGGTAVGLHSVAASWGP